MKKYLFIMLLLSATAWGAADLVKVYGHVYYPTGTAYQGGKVAVTMTTPSNLVDTTSETEERIVAIVPVAAGDGDTVGYWYINLLPSLDYSDTVLYNFQGSWGMEFMGLFLSDVDSLNLADSIAGR